MKWTHHMQNAGQIHVPMIGVAGSLQPPLQRQHQHRHQRRAAPVASSGINVVDRVSQDANVVNQALCAWQRVNGIHNASQGLLLRQSRP